MASNESTTPVDNNPSEGLKKVEKSKVLWIVSLVLWVFTFILLLIALIVLATDTIDREYSLVTYGVHKFDDLYAYRYMLSVIVFGIAYSLLRLAFSIYHYIISDCKAGKVNLLFDFYGDKIISYLLATGAAAGFGVTKDMNRLFDSNYYYSFEQVDDFCAKGYASASLVLIAFLCTATLSVRSSYALANLVGTE
ncbi:hypothetical protein L484_011408 [Morus notabilis]|uniref:CASP-like protein n=1 Tax=Morus notabilis TaxID=981085 RepID=W9S8M3_9ROSA|nr:CASP-like protein 4D1 [Morus notabilis]EXC20164.1 hypothetical protein L484_011408 [Morus notabilis]